MRFEDKLIYLRKSKKMSQEELAEELGVTRQTISKWELGQSKPDMDKLIKLSNFYDMTVDELTTKLIDDVKVKKNEETEETEETEKAEEATSKVVNKEVENKETKPRKWLMYLLILLLLSSVIWLIFNKSVKKENNENIFKQFFGIFYDFDISLKESAEDFNFSFKHNEGTKSKLVTETILDSVVTNNNSNKEHIITVVYGGIETFDVNEIKNIKAKLTDEYDYEISLGYDQNGYIYKMTITLKVNEFAIARFNNSFFGAEGTKWGFLLANILDEIVTSNKSNPEHQIVVVFKNKEISDTKEIKNIKKELEDWTGYEVSVEYDDVGYVNKLVIE